MMDNFPEDIIFTRLKPPFSFRRRGWGMKPKAKQTYPRPSATPFLKERG
jgi:hypothetical protein